MLGRAVHCAGPLWDDIVLYERLPCQHANPCRRAYGGSKYRGKYISSKIVATIVHDAPRFSIYQSAPPFNEVNLTVTLFARALP